MKEQGARGAEAGVPAGVHQPHRRHHRVPRPEQGGHHGHRPDDGRPHQHPARATRASSIEPTEAALDLLVQKGYDATYGARQLRRTIQKHVEDPLAEAIVRGQFGDGARIEVDAEGENFVFREIQMAEPRLALAEH